MSWGGWWMRILFVDDEPKWVVSFKDAIQEWNEDNPERQFQAVVLETAGAAAQALETSRFDCALLDLKFKNEGSPGHQLSGSDLALRGLRDYGIPVGILSGNPEDRDVELQENGLIQAFAKNGDACTEALAWFGGLWDMMRTLEVARRAIRKSGAEIFTQRIWPRWQGYEEIGASGIPLDQIVTRQYAGHIAELMGVDGAGNPDWHPLENYINPALLAHRAHTGDIFRIDGHLWVVLTPQCDMANNSVESVLLAQCDPDLVEGWQDKLNKLKAALNGPDGPSGSLLGWFRDRVNQNIDAAVHFLPPLDDHRPMMVSFKRLRLIPRLELHEMLDEKRVASIAPPFLPNLTQRFAAYMARPGQPNIAVRHFADIPAAKI